jgi:hypothetical protein
VSVSHSETIPDCADEQGDDLTKHFPSQGNNPEHAIKRVHNTVFGDTDMYKHGRNLSDGTKAGNLSFRTTKDGMLYGFELNDQGDFVGYPIMRLEMNGRQNDVPQSPISFRSDSPSTPGSSGSRPDTPDTPGRPLFGTPPSTPNSPGRFFG